jgi:hypothetical protein
VDIPIVHPERNAFSPKEPENVSDEISHLNSVSPGQKRKGEDMVGRPPKKSCLKDIENAGMPEGSKGSEASDRAGKPTLSGRVPLMPSRLAEAGYQGEKKGVRGTGKKVQNIKKPRSKPEGAAKIPGRKKVK